MSQRMSSGKLPVEYMSFTWFIQIIKPRCFLLHARPCDCGKRRNILSGMSKASADKAREMATPSLGPEIKWIYCCLLLTAYISESTGFHTCDSWIKHRTNHHSVLRKAKAPWLKAPVHPLGICHYCRFARFRKALICTDTPLFAGTIFSSEKCPSKQFNKSCLAVLQSSTLGSLEVDLHQFLLATHGSRTPNATLAPGIKPSTK